MLTMILLPRLGHAWEGMNQEMRVKIMEVHQTGSFMRRKIMLYAHHFLHFLLILILPAAKFVTFNETIL